VIRPALCCRAVPTEDSELSDSISLLAFVLVAIAGLVLAALLVLLVGLEALVYWLGGRRRNVRRAYFLALAALLTAALLGVGSALAERARELL